MQSLIFERSILDKINNNKFDEKLSHSEDFSFFLNIAYKYDVFPDREKLVKYRLHKDQNSKKSYIPWYEENNYIFNEIKKIYPYLEIKNPKKFQLFRAKIAYYKCRAIENNEIFGDMSSELFPYKYLHWKYTLLYFSSLWLPIWKIIHYFKKM